MDEVRLVDTLRRANFASLKSPWNNPNSYHMAVLETFPPTQGEINANDAQINFLSPPPLPLLAKLWRQIPTTVSVSNSREFEIGGEEFSREQSGFGVCYAVSSRMKPNESPNAVQGRNREF